MLHVDPRATVADRPDLADPPRVLRHRHVIELHRDGLDPCAVGHGDDVIANLEIARHVTRDLTTERNAIDADARGF